MRFILVPMALSCATLACTTPLLFPPGSKLHPEHGLVLLRVSSDENLLISLGKISGVSTLYAYEFRSGDTPQYLMLEMPTGRYCADSPIACKACSTALESP